jgi:hypothetical protein
MGFFHKLSQPFKIFLVGSMPIAIYLIWFTFQGYGLDKPDIGLNRVDRYTISLLDSLNPISIKIQHEIGGRIILHHDTVENDGIILGGYDHTAIPRFLQTPFTGRNLAHFHTHGNDDPMYDSEGFSLPDTAGSEDIQYLETPRGKIWKHMPKDHLLLEYNRHTKQWTIVQGEMP